MKKENKALLKRIVTGLIALSLIGVGVFYQISYNLEKPLQWWVILLLILGLFVVFVGFTILFDYLARKQDK